MNTFDSSAPLLSVRDLSVAFGHGERQVLAVDRVSFDIKKGETVAEALLEYVDVGVSTILIRGYDPLDDAIDYGRDLLPILRQEMAHRERAGEKVAA